MAIGGVVINFLAKTRDAVSDVDKLTRAVKDTGEESKRADSKMGKLSGTLKGGLVAGAAIAGAGIVALGDFLIEAGKAAVEDQQSSENLANTLGKIPGVTGKAIAANEDWILSMTLATNVADSDLRTAIGRLTLATGDLEEAQKLTTIAVDAAAGSGKSLSSITDAMAKAYDGNTAALKRMFPWLDKNKDGTVTFAEAVDGLGDAYKGASEKAAANDPWTRLQTIWGELKESLGGWLLPLINEFGDWFKNRTNQDRIRDFINAMGDAAKAIGEKLVPAIEDFLDYISSDRYQDDLEEWSDLISALASAAKLASTWVNNLRTYLKLMFQLAAPWWLKLLPQFNGGGGGRTAGAGEFAAPAPSPPSAPPILVTEDQIYRAVHSLLLRGDARAGRQIRLLA